jgi:hypothetical protein
MTFLISKSNPPRWAVTQAASEVYGYSTGSSLMRMASDAGVSIRTVRNWLSGDSPPSVEDMRAIQGAIERRRARMEAMIETLEAASAHCAHVSNPGSRRSPGGAEGVNRP